MSFVRFKHQTPPGSLSLCTVALSCSQHMASVLNNVSLCSLKALQIEAGDLFWSIIHIIVRGRRAKHWGLCVMETGKVLGSSAEFPALFYRSSCHAGGCGALYNLMSPVQVDPKQYTSLLLCSRSWSMHRKCVIQYAFIDQSPGINLASAREALLVFLICSVFIVKSNIMHSWVPVNT